MPQTLVEKIAQRYAVDLDPGHEVHAGDFLTVRPAHVMTHDNTAAVIPKFHNMGARRVADPRQPVFALDHDIQNRSATNLAKYRDIEAFARQHGIAFHPAGRGIGHQVMVEEGFVLPGSFVVGSDSHSNLYGALGALGTPVVRTDAAALWATGTTWWQVPEIVRVHLEGRLQEGTSGKDVIVTLIGRFAHDEVLNCALEFSGPGVEHLGMADRLTIANMTTEWGALAGVFPCDATTRAYLLERAAVLEARGDDPPRLTAARVEEVVAAAPQADPDAAYARDLTLDLGAVSPFVAGPNEVKTITPLPEIAARRQKIDKAFLLSCVNGRVEDFAAAAAVLRGRKVAPNVRLYIAAASSLAEEASRARGDWQVLLDAGATALPPGCGPCIGLGDGVLEDGEVGISATNRNFRGRMGSRDAAVYLASPAVVAASAAAGFISPPPGTDFGSAEAARERLQRGARVQEGRTGGRRDAPARIDILPGFPAEITGELLFVPKDNMNTDGIYGKDWTYTEGMTPEEMASKAMLNYDPAFQELARAGDVLVGGANFGTGSSREQAATALQYRGIRMVIAASFSQTYKRNAFNNGFIVLECPELVEELRAALPPDPPRTVRTGRRVRVDFATARIHCDDHDHPFAPLGRVAQELIARGGFEAVVRARIAALGGGSG